MMSTCESEYKQVREMQITQQFSFAFPPSTLIMPPTCNNSQTHHHFGPVPHVVSYNAALSPNNPEVWTCLDQAIADPCDCVPYGDNLYPTLDEVSLSLLLPFWLWF